MTQLINTTDIRNAAYSHSSGIARRTIEALCDAIEDVGAASVAQDCADAVDNNYKKQCDLLRSRADQLEEENLLLFADLWNLSVYVEQRELDRYAAEWDQDSRELQLVTLFAGQV